MISSESGSKWAGDWSSDSITAYSTERDLGIVRLDVMIARQTKHCTRLWELLTERTKNIKCAWCTDKYNNHKWWETKSQLEKSAWVISKLGICMCRMFCLKHVFRLVGVVLCAGGNLEKRTCEKMSVLSWSVHKTMSAKWCIPYQTCGLKVYWVTKGMRPQWVFA